MSVCWYICCGKDRSGELIQAVQQGDIAQTRALMVAGVYVNDSTLPVRLRRACYMQNLLRLRPVLLWPAVRSSRGRPFSRLRRMAMSTL